MYQEDLCRELTSTRTICKRYVIDDGWNVPEEIIEVIDLRIEQSWKDAIKEVERLKKQHHGEWITMTIAKRYHQIAKPFISFHDGQYVQTLRELGEELKEKYGVTELEAINILNGYHLKDYVDRYKRIRNLIPIGFDAQDICNNTLFEYGYPVKQSELAM